MKTWIVTAGHKCCEEVFENGYRQGWRQAQWRVYSDERPEFELIAVPRGDDKLDAIDVYDTDYEFELIEQRDVWWDEGDYDEELFVESCYIWNFTVEEETA